MKNIFKYAILTIAIMLSAQSCRDINNHNESPQDYAGMNAPDIFDMFWHAMDENYLFWDVDPTDWDQMYYTYKPLFEEIGEIETRADAMKMQKYFKEMTVDIIDGHFYVDFNGQLGLIQPSAERAKKRDDYRKYFTSDQFGENTKNKYLEAGAQSHPDPMLNVNYTYGKVKTEDILYIKIPSFNLSSIIEYYPTNNVTKLLNKFFTDVKAPSTKGIIIDLRANGGGAVRDLDILIGNLIDQPLHIGYSKTKSGRGRLDYSPWIPAYANPQPGAVKIEAPIVILVDINSVSMSEITARTVKELPNGCVIGEVTFGAHGPLLGTNKLLNGGTMNLPFMGNVNTSTFAMKGVSDGNREGVGVDPNIKAPLDVTKFQSGIDNQLERAIQYIKTGN